MEAVYGAVELIGVGLLVSDVGIDFVGQVDHNQILLGVNGGKSAGPALVADGVPGCLDTKIPGTAAVALPPPALPPGGEESLREVKYSSHLR